MKQYIRPLIAISCLYSSIGLYVSTGDVPEWLQGLTIMAVTFWFKARDEEKAK